NNMVVAAVSNRLRRLETTCGVELFERTGRGIRLTGAGRRLVTHAYRILDETRMTEATILGFTGGLAGRVSLHVNTNMLWEHMPRALGPFLAAWPEIAVDLAARPSFELVEMLRKGEVDIGIVAEPADRSGLDCLRFVPDRLAVMVPQSMFPEQTSTSFLELLDHDLLGLDADAPLMLFLTRHATELGRTLKVRMRMPGFEALSELVNAAAGVAIMAESAAQRYAIGRKVRVLWLEEGWARRNLCLL
ncbi:LysR family transcriptional regulator, partial [Thioclava sp. BHET1]